LTPAKSDWPITAKIKMQRKRKMIEKQNWPRECSTLKHHKWGY
jgi:hypothetical protein